MTCNQPVGERKGIQSTVLSTKASADEIPTGFKSPNQKKMMNNENLIRGVLKLSSFTMIVLSTL